MRGLPMRALGVVCCVFAFLVGVSQAQRSPKNPYTTEGDGGKTDKVNVVGTGASKKDALVNVIKGGVNWVLGVLALIALLFLMYGGFQMVTSGGDDDKYGAGFTILKHAAQGLIMIGVAWFVISIIFWLINQTTSTAGSSAGTGS